MKLGSIVTATDNNPLYTEFIPLFITAWKKLIPEADIYIIFIGDSIPEEYLKYKDYIYLIKPIPGVNTAFHAQCIRLLYPRIITRNEGVLITDMDMIPMSRNYYVNTIENFANDFFISLRDELLCINQLCMCYNVALPSTWQLMFGNENDELLIKKWFDNSKYDGIYGGEGWYTDQLILTEMYNKHFGRKVILNDIITNFFRLDRERSNTLFDESNREILTTMIKTSKFGDYHCLRPYSKYKELNDYILDCIPSVNIDNSIFLQKTAPKSRLLKDAQYGTHMAPLVTAVINTKGPVFEMGCSDYSTPILHAICTAQNRQLLSTDTSKEWLKYFMDMENDTHKLIYVPVYDDDWNLNPKPEKWDEIGNQLWSVVFIDHRPGERRKVDIKRFKDNAEIIVVHDTEHEGYEYEEILSTFRYRYDYKRYTVYTTIVSNYIDVSKLFI
jgi:hypothetical protein